MAQAATAPIAVHAGALTRGSNRHTGLLIFAAAFALRVLAAAAFFGSVDTINMVTNSIALAEGKSVLLPYFPTVNALLWVGGVLAAYTHLPLPLCLKLIPILFDSLIALLLYEIIGRSRPRLALLAGYLYVFCPVALLINSFHGQWDSIALLFLLLSLALRARTDSTTRNQFWSGLVFSLSLLVKPIALPLVVLFWPRKGERANAAWAAVAGALAAFTTALAICAAYGLSISKILIGILSYSAKGVQVFGLPFAPGLANLSIQNYRLLWVIPAMSVLGVLYHRLKITATDAILLFYLFTLGTSGLSPQYLLWPVPFLLASGRLRLAALYNAVTMSFLLLYYMNPGASYFPFENLAMFAPLRVIAGIAPPAALATKTLLPFVHALGNVIFPACAWCMAFFVAKSPLRSEPENRFSPLAMYTGTACAVAASVMLGRVLINPAYVRLRLSEIWNQIPAQYALHVQSVNPAPIFVANFGSFSPVNIVLLLAVLTAAWCALALSSAERQPEYASKSPERRGPAL